MTTLGFRRRYNSGPELEGDFKSKFANRDEALRACRAFVDEFYGCHALRGMTANGLVAMFRRYSPYPYIGADEPGYSFALDYARGRAEELAAQLGFGPGDPWTAASILRSPAGDSIRADCEARGLRIGRMLGVGSYSAVFELEGTDPPCVLKIAGVEFGCLARDPDTPTTPHVVPGPHQGIASAGPTGPLSLVTSDELEAAQQLLERARRRQPERGWKLERRWDETMNARRPLLEPWPRRTPPLPSLVECVDLAGRVAAIYERLLGRELRTMDRYDALATLPLVASALDYLHGTFGAHGDLKPEHIVIDGTDVCFLDPLAGDACWMGTSGYMLPGHGSGRVQDVLALAAVAAQCAGGSVGWNVELSTRCANLGSRFARKSTLQADLHRALRLGTWNLPEPLRVWVSETIASVLDRPGVADDSWAHERLAALAQDGALTGGTSRNDGTCTALAKAAALLPTPQSNGEAEWRRLVVSFGEPVRATTVSDTEVAEAIADGRALRIATSRDGFGGGDVRFYLLAPGEAVEGRGMNSGEYWDSWIFPRPCRLTDSILAVLDRNLWESESDVVCPLVQRGCANSTPFRPVVEPLEPIAPAIPVPDRPVAPPRPLPAPERAPPLGPEDVRLVRAIMAGDAAAVSAQLQQGYDPNHELKVDGIVRLSVPVLYLAVATCQTAIVRLLVERGANPNSYMTYRTHLEHRLCPCWRAARDPGLRSFLLAHGGDPRAEAREGEDTSYAVARVDNDEPFELLSCALGLPAFPKNEMG